MQFLIIVGLILVILFGTSQCDGEDSKDDKPSTEVTESDSNDDLGTGWADFETGWVDVEKEDTSPPSQTKGFSKTVAPNRENISTARLLSEAKPLDSVNVGICANPAEQVETMKEEWDKENNWAYVIGYDEPEPNKDGELNTNIRIFAEGTSTPQPLEGDILSIARNQTFNRTFLMAKADIIRALYVKITANNYVKKRPSGLTMGTKIDDMRQSLLKEEKQLEGELEKLNEEMDGLSEAVVDAREDELAGITIGDRVDSLLEAATKKLDATYNSEQTSQQEKQRAEELSQRLNRMEEKRRALTGSVKALDDEMNLFKNRIDSASEGVLLSFYALYGAKVVKQFHCYDAKTRRYALATRVVWSTKLQEEAELAMTGKTTGLAGEDSARVYFAKLKTDLPTADRYIDDRGDPYFWTSRISEYNGEELVGVDEFLEGQARIALAQVLYSDVYAKTTTREMMSTFDGLDTTLGIKDVEIDLNTAVKNARIRGMVARSFFTDDPYSNQKLRVSVAYVDMQAAARSLDLMAEIAASKKRILEDQAYIDSFRQAVIDDAESARDDPASAARGYQDGGDKMNQIEGKRNAPNQNAAPKSESKIKIENSGAFESDAVVDDF